MRENEWENFVEEGRVDFGKHEKNLREGKEKK